MPLIAHYLNVCYRDIIITKHPSMLVWLIFCLHWSWTLGIWNALTFDRTQLSYGQVLSLFVPLPAFWSFCEILRDSSHQVELKMHLRSIPSYIGQGISFTLTGRSEWSTTEIVERDYFHWSRRTWIISEYRTPDGSD